MQSHIVPWETLDSQSSVDALYFKNQIHLIQRRIAPWETLVSYQPDAESNCSLSDSVLVVICTCALLKNEIAGTNHMNALGERSNSARIQHVYTCEWTWAAIKWRRHPWCFHLWTHWTWAVIKWCGHLDVCACRRTRVTIEWCIRHFRSFLKLQIIVEAERSLWQTAGLHIRTDMRKTGIWFLYISGRSRHQHTCIVQMWCLWNNVACMHVHTVVYDEHMFSAYVLCICSLCSLHMFSANFPEINTSTHLCCKNVMSMHRRDMRASCKTGSNCLEFFKKCWHLHNLVWDGYFTSTLRRGIIASAQTRFRSVSDLCSLLSAIEEFYRRAVLDSSSKGGSKNLDLVIRFDRDLPSIYVAKLFCGRVHQRSMWCKGGFGHSGGVVRESPRLRCSSHTPLEMTYWLNYVIVAWLWTSERTF